MGSKVGRLAVLATAAAAGAATATSQMEPSSSSSSSSSSTSTYNANNNEVERHHHVVDEGGAVKFTVAPPPSGAGVGGGLHLSLVQAWAAPFAAPPHTLTPPALVVSVTRRLSQPQVSAPREPGT